jgi:membrane associated rhomboid family serine protease
MILVFQDNEDKTTPWMTYLIILACCLVYWREVALLVDGAGDEFIKRHAFNAYDQLVHLRGWPRALAAFRAVFDPRLPRFGTALTAIFLHGGPSHLAWNMFVLWIFGTNVEHVMGRARYLAFYLLTGLLAGFFGAFMSADYDVPCLGASGAISGLLGAYLMYFPRTNVRVLIIWLDSIYPVRSFEMPAWIYLLFGFGADLAVGIATLDKFTDVGVWYHVGGFLGGMALAWAFKDPEMVFMRDAGTMMRIGRAETHRIPPAYDPFGKPEDQE